MMKFKYETGIATFIQFVTLVLLNVVTGTVSTVSACRTDSGGCIGDLLLALIFFLLITGWFACVWMLGYAAQEFRSRRLAYLLIGAEVLIAMVALFNARHHTDIASLITSLVDFALAVWVITLAYRLARADGGRVVKKQRTRTRRRKKNA